MELPSNLTASELQWSRPHRSKRAFELHGGDTILATLTWTRGSRALAQWGASQYQFSREGWLRPRVLVRDASAPESAEPLASCTQRGGTLTFPDGRVFLWKKPKRLTSERTWTNAAGTEFVRFRPARIATDVVIATAASTSPELPLLVLLGQFILVLAAQDAEAASTAATVAIIAST
jgi:hypothetical protein